MKIEITQDDITKQATKAIVNAAGRSLDKGLGVSGAIHRAAGNDLAKECRLLGGCEVGHAKITRGYNLLAKLVIHTVGPNYQVSPKDAEKELHSCYYETLKLANEYKCEAVSFPAISCGKFGFPKDEAAKIALETIWAHEHEFPNIKLVRFCLFEEDTYLAFKDALSQAK